MLSFPITIQNFQDYSESQEFLQCFDEDGETVRFIIGFRNSAINTRRNFDSCKQFLSPFKL